jgi:hypothetical protein
MCLSASPSPPHRVQMVEKEQDEVQYKRHISSKIEGVQSVRPWAFETSIHLDIMAVCNSWRLLNYVWYLKLSARRLGTSIEWLLSPTKIRGDPLLNCQNRVACRTGSCLSIIVQTIRDQVLLGVSLIRNKFHKHSGYTMSLSRSLWHSKLVS